VPPPGSICHPAPAPAAPLCRGPAAEIRRFPKLSGPGAFLGTGFALMGVPAEQTGK